MSKEPELLYEFRVTDTAGIGFADIIFTQVLHLLSEEADLLGWAECWELRLIEQVGREFRFEVWGKYEEEPEDV